MAMVDVIFDNLTPHFWYINNASMYDAVLKRKKSLIFYSLQKYVSGSGEHHEMNFSG